MTTDEMICMNEDHEHISRDDARSCSCAHVWDYGQSEADPIYCVKCGADGCA